MANLSSFTQHITEGYTFSDDSLTLGGAMLDGQAVKGLHVKAPLRMFNRHGLIAGATGTGKTKTLQALAESLAINGISSLLMDIKGDLSGISRKGTPNPKIAERAEKTGLDWTPTQISTEFLTISKENGVRLRATISEFGPVLLSKILDLNETQGGLVALIFKFCDDKKLPLLDIKDFRKALQYVANDAKEEVENAYGLISSSSVGTVMRKLLEIEEQGAEVFFGERSFDVEDLTDLDEHGRGKVYVLRLADIQSKPKLFSTFMLCLLAEIYEKFPEKGDKENPELVLFIDEAHLIFDEASDALLDQLETIIKLIRSKGVGIFFCTQNPTDIPDAILSQLGMKIQHALRAFTPKDRAGIKKTAENYPESTYYQTDALLTQLGIGEAIVTVLNEKGIPTPLAHTMMIAPRTRMDVITKEELDENVRASALAKKYNEEIDRESAFEILSDKLKQKSAGGSQTESTQPESSRKAEKSDFEKILESKTTQVILKEVTRGILGVLGAKTSRRRSSSGGLGGILGF
jgi:DNA helicase HerA-like ATPase